MPVHLRTPRRGRSLHRRAAIRLHIETLETRYLPSITTWPDFLHPFAETGTNDTLDQAQHLGDLAVTPRVEVVGTIGRGTAGAADVDWYSFRLERAASVMLTTPPALGKSQALTTLSLYNSDPNDASDYYDPLGYRLLAQADGAGQPGGPRIGQRLASGTYYIAVSGSGNDYFHPFLADSGLGGTTGDYGLLITAADLGLGPTAGPIVLGADPSPGSLDRSPFVVRIDLSGALDPATISTDTVQLIRNDHGTFGDGTDQPVPLVQVHFSPMANELQAEPAAPLAPGFYKISLAGNARLHTLVLADPYGIPLARTTSQPAGVDYSYTFKIISNEGDAAAGFTADDTPAGAHQLGDVSNLGFLQLSGAIGDDSTDPIPYDPADVDLYHFHISGPGHHAFLAEVFAGRIGSPLDPALSLFRSGGDGQLQLLAANDNTLNDSGATNGTMPLATDPVLYAGLMQGDYYLAVSGAGNVPDPLLGLLPGASGIFDPNVSHSGRAGDSTGPYLLNLHVKEDDVPPRVVSTVPQEGGVLSVSPTNLSIGFSKPIDLQQLAYSSTSVVAWSGGQATTGSGLEAVYILGPDGRKYYPRLSSCDLTTARAEFLMLDGLPNATYELHISGSGPSGVTDFAGNPLAGNDPRGDYVVHFTVNDTLRGANPDPLQRFGQEPNDTVASPQDLGVLFPHDLEAGVTVTRDPSLDPDITLADSADYYCFQVLQSRDYILNLSGSGLPPGAEPTLADAAGNPISTVSQGSGGAVRVSLDPGTYVVGVGGWQSAQAPGVSYRLRISLGTALENPTPLTVGPAPAYRIALAFNPSPAFVAGSTVTQAPAPALPSVVLSTPSNTATVTASFSVQTPTAPPVGQSTTDQGAQSATLTSSVAVSAPPGATAGTGRQRPSAAAALTPASLPSSSAPAPASSLINPVPLPGPSISVSHVDPSALAEESKSPILLIGNYGIAGDVSSFAIPSELLASLSALPLGGVRAENRRALPFDNQRVLSRSGEPRIRLTMLNPSSVLSEAIEPQFAPPIEQSKLPTLPAPPVGDEIQGFDGDYATRVKNFAHNLASVWRRTLEVLFMDLRCQGCPGERLEGLTPSSLEEAGPDSSSEEQDGFVSALSNRFSDEPQNSGTEVWAYAGLLLGIPTQFLFPSAGKGKKHERR